MWRAQWINESVRIGRLFNNERVFQTIEMESDEYENPITYRPLTEYLQRRFIPHVATLGPSRVDEQLRRPLVGQAHDFSRETRVLAFLTGLRETGLPLVVGHRPSDSESYEVISGTVYIRNFAGSGLDHINQSGARRGVLGHLESYARHRSRQHLFARQIVRDDPSSDDPADVLINQQWLRIIFNAYLRYQQEEFLRGMDLESMNRHVRLFWRALTFGAQRGNNWRNSQRAPGLDTVKNLMNLLGLSYGEVPSLWNESRIRNQVAQINDEERERLASLARMENNFGSIERIRERIPLQIRSGLSNARYFQAIKMAAITDGFLICMNQGVFR